MRIYILVSLALILNACGQQNQLHAEDLPRDSQGAVLSSESGPEQRVNDTSALEAKVDRLISLIEAQRAEKLAETSQIKAWVNCDKTCTELWEKIVSHHDGDRDFTDEESKQLDTCHKKCEKLRPDTMSPEC